MNTGNAIVGQDLQRAEKPRVTIEGMTPGGNPANNIGTVVPHVTAGVAGTQAATPVGVAPACKLVAAIRLDNLCGRPQAIAAAGKGLPLLLLLIHRCGSGATVVCSYAELGTHLGVTGSTVKTWAKELAMAGLIVKKAAGASGVKITLADSIAEDMELANRICETLRGAADRLMSVNGLATTTLWTITDDLIRLAQQVDTQRSGS